MNKKIVWGILVLVVLVGGWFYFQNSEPVQNSIKVGIVTDLTGPAAYWGESTRAGAQIAAEELKSEGYYVTLLFEDYQLDAAKAASATHKLLSVDDVDAIYAEFNPGTIAAASVIGERNVLYIYDAAIVSPLETVPNAFKTYLDYQEGCKQVAEKFKNDGVAKIGVLKVGLEFGELCEMGVKEAYGTDVVSEGYNLGDTDFRTQLLKLNSLEVGAVINVGFEGETISALKTIKEFEYDMKYGTVGDTVTEQVLSNYGKEIAGGYSFGFANVSEEFLTKLSKKGEFSSPYGAAIAYTHVRQIADSIAQCGGDSECYVAHMQNSKTDDTIGFRGFTNRIADLSMTIVSY